MKPFTTILLGLLLFQVGAQAQLRTFNYDDSKGLSLAAVIKAGGQTLDISTDLLSLKLGEDLVKSHRFELVNGGSGKSYQFDSKLQIQIAQDLNFNQGIKLLVKFMNIGQDTLELHNVLPFGEAPDRVYITGKDRHYLSRTHLFRPGQIPVNVIVPDNAWNLGFAEMELESMNLYGLSRRAGSEKARIARFENYLYPTGWVEYEFYFEAYHGNWQAGLRGAFQDRWLYDLVEFDQELYERDDLKWIQRSYVSHLIYGWDHQFYDSETLEFNLDEFLARGRNWYGGDDFVGIWPTWPSLGLDQRNQWDLFRDLPGGLAGLNEIASQCRAQGTRFFICYNPWDEDTRSESHTLGMADLIDQIGADGVVLDTRGSSSLELQRAADSVRQGVVMYSEGMAVPKDMPGIVSGRVHNALYYPPMLNLNKLIKPDFAIFRVAELAYEPIRREYATSFFNGYGTELNIFRPGRPDWIEADYRFFGESVRILREHSSCFVSFAYEPLIPTLSDDIWVNCWPGANKTIYTVFSLLPEGFDQALFEAPEKEAYHWIDLWEHRDIDVVDRGGKSFIPVRTEAFHQSWLGTNNEGAISAIAHFPELIQLEGFADEVKIAASQGDSIKIWAGKPSYEKQAVCLPAGTHHLDLTELFGRFEGDIIIQLFRETELIDEQIYQLHIATARLISQVTATEPAKTKNPGMVAIPPGSFVFKTSHGDEFIPYPLVKDQEPVMMKGFLMDQYPVTNQEYYQFVKKAGYQPDDTVNYLKHWVNDMPTIADKNKPVVYLSWEDAKAYAQWAGKRLPTEMEWQYAAQTADLRPWPWTTQDTIKREEQYVTNTLTVSRLQGVGERFCNPGNGVLDAVGSYPDGANPFGLHDLVGSVWQLTNDLYDNGSNHYIMMKGGSYFNPGSSWWYVQGGPRPLTYRQMLLRVSRGFERNATVGFRCIRD